MNYNVALPFYTHAISQPNANALVVNQTPVTYSSLARLAQQNAKLFTSNFGAKRMPRIGILSAYTLEAYVGILAAAWAGGTYVAINPKWPASRIQALLKIAALDAIFTDAAGTDLLSAPELKNICPQIIMVETTLADEQPLAPPAEMSATSLAYIMFTSGSTGQPKGVMIECQSVRAYVSALQSLYQISSSDRMGQFSELSFDFSVMDLFMTWNGGAALYVLVSKYRLLPGEFIKNNQLTIWASVPSVVTLIGASGKMRTGTCPTLRLAIFCGEPLTTQMAANFQAFAPHAKIENHYGPTEATVSCGLYSVVGPVKTTLQRDVISIGKAFGDTKLAIMSEETQEFLAADATGEICIAGSQLAQGYLNDPVQTNAKFRVIRHPEYGTLRWYLSGDRGFFDKEGDFHHLGRLDNQIKFKGFRIDLEDIESHLRTAAATDETAVAMVKVGGFQALVAAIVNSERTDDEIRASLVSALPPYMVPTKVKRLAELPKGPSGKIDRRALAVILEQEVLS